MTLPTSGRALYTAAWIGDSDGIGPLPAIRLPAKLTVQISLGPASTPANRGLIKNVSVPGMRALRCPEPESTPSPVMTCNPSTRRRFRFSILDASALKSTGFCFWILELLELLNLEL